MGTLFRLLLGLFGVRVKTSPHLSEVSKTIDSIRVPKQQRSIWGGLLHLAPVIVVLVFVYFERAAEVSRSRNEIVALLLAVAWVWVGPVLIWYYEKYALTQFMRSCRHIVVDPLAYVAIRRAVYQNVYALPFFWLFAPLWILFVVLTFIAADKFVSGFGFRGRHDAIWWLVLLGVLLISYYTSLGFCLAHKAIYLTRLVARARLDRAIYHVDGVFGLSFIGDFAFKTSAMFLSGWLFAPLILMSTSFQSVGDYLVSVQNVLLTTYFVFTIASFFVPIYIIHFKILREKELRSRQLYNAANQIVGAAPAIDIEKTSKQLEFFRKIFDDIRAVPNWPLRLDTALKFILTSIFVPALAGALSAILKAHAAGP